MFPLIHFEMHWPSSGHPSHGCSKRRLCLSSCCKYFEASIIAGLLIFNAALAYFQEGRAQATLKALNSRLALNASVERDGVWKTVPAAQLVRGDLVKLLLGGVVAADVHLIGGSVLLDCLANLQKRDASRERQQLEDC
jgi:magnesium-transporting ATPase (P-type)